VAERARLNVTRALRAAIAKVTEALPAPGTVLDRRVRTGLYCAYLPATRAGLSARRATTVPGSSAHRAGAAQARESSLHSRYDLV
jgi:hypothetical protein